LIHIQHEAVYRKDVRSSWRLRAKRVRARCGSVRARALISVLELKIMAAKNIDPKLYLALKDALCALEYDDWIGLGILTGERDWIEDHPRLLRSRHFGDDDYGACVFSFLDHALSDQKTLGTLLQYPEVDQWLKQHKPELYTRFVRPLAEVSLGLNVDRYLERLHLAVERRDSPMVIGTAKEMLEALFKGVLDRHGEMSASQDILELWKQVRAKLDLSVEGVNSNKQGAEPLRRLLAGLSSIVHSVCELRNLYGTGHGRGNEAPELDFSTTLLVADSATALARYLDSRYQALKFDSVEVPF
jgi:hypothetical protein